MLRQNIIKLFRSTLCNRNINELQHLKVNNILLNNIDYINGYNYKYLSSTVQHDYQNIDQTKTKKLTEEEYLVKIKNDPDTFGIESNEITEYDEGDIKEEEYLENPASPTQQLSTKQYADMIKALIRKKKIKEAIDVLEVRMIKHDRVKPENYIYNLILGACGRVGYTKKAFSLYNRMKQRNLKATGGTYTALFNACANSPWQEDGLSRARHLRDIMIETGYEPNETNYNAMIKAFGHCGDIGMAFSLVDEMAQKQFFIRADTLNFLLQACITDKEAGFRHALLVWRKFIKRRIIPDIYSYNLLLKCICECGLGDTEVTKDVFDNIVQNTNLLNKSSNQNLLSSGDKALDDVKNMYIKAPTLHVDILENRPNLITKIPRLGNVLAVSEIIKSEDRLLLVGGCSGFLQDMQDNQCTPDIKTFTLLLESIPSTLAAEKDLIIATKRFNVKPDIDFFNMLIKKRSMRFDYELAKDVLTLIKAAKFKPNVITYGVLALGCQTKEEAESLIENMKNANYRMNTEILGAMLHQACYFCNFKYVLEVMEISIREEIRPNKKFMECLEEFRKKCKKLSNDPSSNMAKTTAFQKGFQIFKLRYKTWKEEANPITEEESHPWQQFRQEVRTDVRHYKDKEMSSRFKPRHTSLYRQKTNKPLGSKYGNKVDFYRNKNKNVKVKTQINQT